MPNLKKQKNAKSKTVHMKRELVYATEDQLYASVSKHLGGNHLQCDCFDGKQRLGIIRGNMKRKFGKLGIIGVGDIVIVSLRDYQDTKADIIHRYTPDEVAFLQRTKVIPRLGEDEYCDMFEFAYEDEKETIVVDEI